MNKSFLHDLYFDGLSPLERGRVQDPEFDALIGKVRDIEVHFRKTLSAEEYEKLEEMGNLRVQAGTIENAELFRYAFSMGVLMMSDVLRFRESD